jgi:DNA-directed RNA polymerase specialized sigma24 family protein
MRSVTASDPGVLWVERLIMSAPETPARTSLFATTRWSVVLAARGDGVERDAAGALETLCGTYWPALYAYARRHGYSPHDSEDATQGFFARLLEKDYLQAVQRERGPFRAFLQMAFSRFLSKERDRAGAAQRGGGVAHLSLDFPTAESICASDAPQLAADEVFELRWAMTVLETVMGRLREEFKGGGKLDEFEVLKVTLHAAKDGIGYAEIAASLGVSEGAARVAVHRLRKRFRELFREEVAQTVATHEEVDEELRHLAAVLARA